METTKASPPSVDTSSCRRRDGAWCMAHGTGGGGGGHAWSLHEPVNGGMKPGWRLGGCSTVVEENHAWNLSRAGRLLTPLVVVFSPAAVVTAQGDSKSESPATPTKSSRITRNRVDRQIVSSPSPGPARPPAQPCARACGEIRTGRRTTVPSAGSWCSKRRGSCTCEIGCPWGHVTSS